MNPRALAFSVIGVCALLAAASVAGAQGIGRLTPHGVKVDTVQYQKKRAVRLTSLGDTPAGQAYAIVNGAQFHNGAIEVEVAGKPAEGAGPAARGFIGIAFRIREGGGEFECIYLRPTNGRADDQVRRNHSTQYASIPRFDFAEMRRQWPERYESYVDLETGAWTRYRITVEGTKARLYVNGSPQPVLIVNDLKLGDSSGGVALWIEPGTEGYFARLRITPAR